MAVNINTVYTTVLYILNKEQRGYITPTEFNSLALQVQDEILASYFPDGNQLNRLNQNNTQNDTEFFNLYKDLSYKLYPFENEINFYYDTGYSTSVNAFVPQRTDRLYKLGNVVCNYNSTGANPSPIAQCVSVKDFNTIKRSRLTAPTKQYPIYYTTNANVQEVLATATVNQSTTNLNSAVVTVTSGTMQPLQVIGTNVLPNTIATSYNPTNPGDNTVGTLTFNKANSLNQGDVLTLVSSQYNSLILKIDPLPNSITVNGISNPIDPLWNFTIGGVGQYIYEAQGSADFSLDISEKTNIIVRILKYCGIIINDPTIIQVAEQESQKIEANEKS